MEYRPISDDERVQIFFRENEKSEFKKTDNIIPSSLVQCGICIVSERRQLKSE